MRSTDSRHVPRSVLDRARSLPGTLRDIGREAARPPAGWQGPVLLRSLNAALAASLAWLLVQPLGGIADAYPYLAPLGAVITVSQSVAASAKEAAVVIVNLVLGALLGTVALQVGLPVALALALLIGLGTALHAVRPLAPGASWVSYSAVLVLVVGSEDPLGYGVAYAGLTSLGAGIGLLTMSVLPPLLIAPGTQVISQAGTAIARQLDDLADGLAHDEPLTQEEWLPLQQTLATPWRHLADTVQMASQARRGNWRARRWVTRTSEQDRVARRIEATFPLVQHLTMLLSHDERADRSELALGPTLRPAAATVLRAWSRLVRCVAEGEDAAAATARLTEALDRLAQALRSSRRSTAADSFTAGAVVSTVRRGMEVLTQDA